MIKIIPFNILSSSKYYFCWPTFTTPNDENTHKTHKQQMKMGKKVKKKKKKPWYPTVHPLARVTFFYFYT